jgi:hypothetical protein
MPPVPDAAQTFRFLHSSLSQRAAEAALGAGAAACAFGIARSGLWREVPANRFAESLLLAGLVALLAWPLRRWRGWPWAGAMAFVWAVFLAVLGGVLPMLAALLVAATAMSLGGLVAPARPVLAWLSGLAILAGTLGWLLLLPVHRWWIYLPLFALLVVAGRRRLQSQLAGLAGACRDAVHASPRIAAWTIVVLGIASAAAWAPTMQYDDLAYHLGLPWQLMLHGRYAPDPGQQDWSLAPWAGDIWQALPQVLARSEARSAVNLGWLLATAAGLWRLGALVGLRPAYRWATVALYATLPMTAVLLGGMQTETAGAATMVWLAVVVVDRDAGPRRLFAGALLFGLSCALKPVHAVAALPLLAWAAWRHRGARRRPAALALAAVLVVLVGGSSYAFSWHATGNPVLPLFNDVFRSPWFPPTAFVDQNWQQGLGPKTFWRMTFNADAYVEGFDGALGLVLVALSGAWLLALADRRTRALAACATLAIVVPLLPMQYSRYVHPGMVLLLPALAAAVQRHAPGRAGTALLAATCVAGLALQANSGWMLHTGVEKRTLLALGRGGPLFEDYVPERALAAAIRARAPASGPVLLLSQPFQAEFAGRGRDVDWYAPRMQAAAHRADRDPTGAAWAALLRREHIAEVILAPATTPAPRLAGLARLGARPAMDVDGTQWWRIPPQETAR